MGTRMEISYPNALNTPNALNAHNAPNAPNAPNHLFCFTELSNMVKYTLSAGGNNE